MRPAAFLGMVLLAAPGCGTEVRAQVAPSAIETARYAGLFAAAARGDAAEITRLAAAGGDLEARDGHRRTPLHVAAHASRADAMRALVKAGADPNALEHDRYDIESIVLGDGGPRHRATLGALVDAGASVNIADRSGASPLQLAQSRGYREMVAILQQAGGR